MDEYGDPNLNTEKDGTTQYFICTAIILAGDDLAAADEILKAVRATYFSGSEIKSSSAAKPERRLKILAELAKINFRFMALVVDKDRIYKDSGFQYKKTFYKQIHRRLYSQFSDLGVSLNIMTDSLGGPDFVASFKAYIEKNVLPSLFNDCQFELGDSRQINFLQLADFITGTLGHSFDPKKKNQFSPVFRSALREKELALDAWPPFFKDATSGACPAGSRHDIYIERICYSQAQDFIDKYSEDWSRAAQIDALLLLIYAKWGGADGDSPVRYHTESILAHLERLGHGEMTDQDFRRDVIGPLRDAGILISGNKNGYSLATTLEEIEDFLKHGKMILFPMISRINTAAQTIKKATSGGCDILANPGHNDLKSLVDKFSDLRLGLDCETVGLDEPDSI